MERNRLRKTVRQRVGLRKRDWLHTETERMRTENAQSTRKFTSVWWEKKGQGQLFRSWILMSCPLCVVNSGWETDRQTQRDRHSETDWQADYDGQLLTSTALVTFVQSFDFTTIFNVTCVALVRQFNQTAVASTNAIFARHCCRVTDVERLALL